MSLGLIGALILALTATVDRIVKKQEVMQENGAVCR